MASPFDSTSLGPDHVVRALHSAGEVVATEEYVDDASEHLQGQINALPVPENTASLDKQNVYVKTQTVDKEYGVAWKTKKDGSDTLKIHSDGTLEQIDAHANNAPGELVNRQNLTDAIDAIEIPEVNLDEYATIEYVDDASERLQGQINGLVIEGTDIYRVAGEWDFRPLQGNDTLEDGFVKIEAPGNWYEWEDPSTWTHITIPIKDQNNKSHPGLANIGAGEIIEYKGMHEAAWMTSRPAELVQENGVDAYKFQVTFVNGTNEGSRLIDGLLLNKYSTPPSEDPGGGGEPIAPELPDNLAQTDQINHFTARQNIELDSGTGLLIKKGDDESFKLFADGTAEQLIEHDNVKPGNMVTRKNLTDALDNVSLGSALEEADNNFKGSQSFRIGGTHGSPIQVYAPKNGGGEQEIFAVSVVPANDDKVGERETESSAYYRGRIASDTSLVNKKYVDDAVESIDLEAYVTKENATSEITYRDKIFEEIFEDIDDALIDLMRTDQTLTDGLATVNTDAAFLDKLNRFTARQKIDVPDSVALQITKNNATTLDVWSTGEIQQKDERPNSHPQQFVTRKNVEGMVNNYRPYSWADHTVAGDLTPGECFIAGNGNLYCHILDANNEPICIDGTYGNGAKSVIYYRNASGDAVELFSTTGMHCYEGSYIRFDGEEEVLKNAANSGMTHLESPLFI